RTIFAEPNVGKETDRPSILRYDYRAMEDTRPSFPAAVAAARGETESGRLIRGIGDVKSFPFPPLQRPAREIEVVRRWGGGSGGGGRQHEGQKHVHVGYPPSKKKPVAWWAWSRGIELAD